MDSFRPKTIRLHLSSGRGTSPFCALLRAAFFSVSVVLSFTLPAQADPGQRRILETRVITLEGPFADQAVERALSIDLHQSLRRFSPVVPRRQPIKIGRSEFSSIGPRGRPRISFPAEVNLLGGVDATVRGDLSVLRHSCSDSAARGKRISLNLIDSAKLVTDNASAFDVTLCWKPLTDGSVQITAQSSYIEGTNRGTFAGPACEMMLKAQTDPIVNAFLSQINIIQGAVQSESVQRDIEHVLQPPCATCGGP